MSESTKWFKNLKDMNFGRSNEELKDVEDILGTNKFDKCKIEHYIEILKELDKLKIKSKKDFPKKFKHISMANLSRVYFKYILWPEWMDVETTYKNIISYDLLDLFQGNRIRGSYGVVNITIVTEPLKSCAYMCVFCPHGPEEGVFKVPISYDMKEPAVARGARVNYYIIAQIRIRIKDLCMSGVIRRKLQADGTWKTVTKIDVRLAGGTFNSYPIEKQDEFINHVYYAVDTIDCNDNDMPIIRPLDYYIKRHIEGKNEVKIVGLSVETRPDEINHETCKRFNKYMLTWVELGIQTGAVTNKLNVYNVEHDEIFKKIKRGHNTKSVILAIALLKFYGFKVLGHFMQDLPGTSPELDKQVFKNGKMENKSKLQQNLILICLMIFTILHFAFKSKFMIVQTVVTVIFYYFANNPYIEIQCLPFRCDHIKIYPAMKLPFTKMATWGKEKWRRYSEEENGSLIMDVLCYIVQSLPNWVRIARLIRDFEKATEKNNYQGFDSETIMTNMAQLVTEKLKNDNIKCNEIKCREIGKKSVNLNKINFKMYSYTDGLEFSEYKGTEYFGNFEASDENNELKMVGLFRLRLNYKMNYAMIREIHVYGGHIAAGINPGNTNLVQHRGFGKRLVRICEIISYFYGYKKIKIISAPGTVCYYRDKCGYYIEGRYMVKKLNFSEFINSVYIESINFILSYINYFIK